MSWDPEQPPDPEAWLALDASDQAEQIERWHRENPAPALHPPDLNLAVHGAMHALIERQLAADDPPAVGETLERLRAAGLRRHPAVHAIAWVMMERMQATMASGRPFDADAYAAALRRLRAEEAIPVQGLSWMDAAGDRGPNRPAARPNRAARRKKRQD